MTTGFGVQNILDKDYVIASYEAVFRHAEAEVEKNPKVIDVLKSARDEKDTLLIAFKIKHLKQILFSVEDFVRCGDICLGKLNAHTSPLTYHPRPLRAVLN